LRVRIKKSQFTIDPRLYQLYYYSTHIIEPVANCRRVASQTRKRQRVIFFWMVLNKNNDGKNVLFPIITYTKNIIVDWPLVWRCPELDDTGVSRPVHILYNIYTIILYYYLDGWSDVHSGGWKTATADIMIIDHYVTITVKTFGIFFFVFILLYPPHLAHQRHRTIFAFARMVFWWSNRVAPDPFTVYWCGV